jgi:murein DD-endopeptidase MepM/ murein hydrolase activator NlpD
MVDSKIFIPPQKNYSVIDKILEQKIYKKNKKYTKIINFDSKLIKYAPKFMWPLKGDVVKNFGKFGRGLHYDGIDINSKKNIPIVSSFNG